MRGFRPVQVPVPVRQTAEFPSARRPRALLQFPNMGGDGGGGGGGGGGQSAEPERKFAFGSFRSKISSPTTAPTRGFWHGT